MVLHRPLEFFFHFYFSSTSAAASFIVSSHPFASLRLYQPARLCYSAAVSFDDERRKHWRRGASFSLRHARHFCDEGKNGEEKNKTIFHSIRCEDLGRSNVVFAKVFMAPIFKVNDAAHITEYCRNMSEIFPIFYCH